MKALGRSYVWWPSINKDLEDVAHKCEDCQKNYKEDQRTHLHPLEQHSKPWQRVHLDFAGPFLGQMWLIMKFLSATNIISPDVLSPLVKCLVLRLKPTETFY